LIKQLNKNRRKDDFEACEKPARRADIKAIKQKRAACERAADFVKDGITIGLGTGSTVYRTVRRLGELVIKENKSFAPPDFPANRKSSPRMQHVVAGASGIEIIERGSRKL
jgi:hypothetical protein